MKSETSLKVVFLKEHRKIASKILFPNEKVFLRLQPKYHRAIVLYKQHIVQWSESMGCKNCKMKLLCVNRAPARAQYNGI